MGKVVKVLAAFVLIAMVFSMAACGEADPAPSAGTDEPVEEQSEPPSDEAVEPVEIIYWGDWSGEGQKQFEHMMDLFNESQDQIVAKYVVTQDMITKFLTASASGDAPDIMFWDRVQTALYAPKGVLHPIDAYMEQDGVSADEFYVEAVKELSWNDNVYGLPLTVDCRALFYNKKLFAEAGIENPPTTWEELEEAAIALTVWNDGKLERAGMSMQDVGLFSMWLRQAGGQMLTDDGTKTAFNSEEGLAVLNFWDKLVNQDKVYSIGFESGLGEGTDAFATGKVAMTYSGPWMLSTYKNYGQDLDFGIVPPPAGPGGDKGSVLGGFGLVIPEGAQHKDEAWELMKWWLATPENAAEYCKSSLNIPGLKAAALDSFFAEDPLYTPFLETFEFAKIRPRVTGYSTMEGNALVPNLQLFMEGKMTAAEALQTAQEAGDKMLAENALQ